MTNIKGTIYLSSVASYIDIYGNVYPAMDNGKPDMLNSTHLSDCSEEWLKGLSGADKYVVRLLTPNFY